MIHRHAIFFNFAEHSHWKCLPHDVESDSMLDLIEHVRADDLPCDILNLVTSPEVTDL